MGEINVTNRTAWHIDNAKLLESVQPKLPQGVKELVVDMEVRRDDGSIGLMLSYVEEKGDRYIFCDVNAKTVEGAMEQLGRCNNDGRRWSDVPFRNRTEGHIGAITQQGLLQSVAPRKPEGVYVNSTVSPSAYRVTLSYEAHGKFVELCSGRAGTRDAAFEDLKSNCGEAAKK